jgi:rare lipoprotein A
MLRVSRIAVLIALYLAGTTVAMAAKPKPCRTGGTACVSGIASWYGKELQGRRTASGERFNRSDLTAAHPFLPFQTKLLVTNLSNGRTVIVRVNDRGPIANGRMIDLSEAAARQLGMTSRGFTLVELRVATDDMVAARTPAKPVHRRAIVLSATGS